VTDLACSNYKECGDECEEDAVQLLESSEAPLIDYPRCLSCGRCLAICPTGTLVAGQSGYRIQLGGKLGRYPRLARELPGIFTETQFLDIVRECITFYKKKSKGGARFAEILSEKDFEHLVKSYR
jgi:dissimilatory sulfite reductase (desulfoviridin) alpha/beta subunit